MAVGLRSFQAEPMLCLACRRVAVSGHEREAIRVVEMATDRVVLEHVELEVRPQRLGVIHQGTADPLTVTARMDEDGSDLVADERHKAGDVIVELIHERLGHRNPAIRDLFSLGNEELSGKERVRNEGRLVPGIENLVEIGVGVGTDHTSSNRPR